MENGIDLIEVAKTIWSKRKKIFLWAVIGLVSGVVIAFSMPSEYECVVRVAPENKDQSASQLGTFGNIASMAGISGLNSSTSGLNEMIYPEIIKSVPFIMDFYDIEVEWEGKKILLRDYLDEKQKHAWWSYILKLPGAIIKPGKGRERAGDVAANPYILTIKEHGFRNQFSRRVFASQNSKNRLISVEVIMQDPVMAAQVADSVVVNLNAFIAKYRTSKARQDLQTSESMYQDAREAYYNADEAYAAAADQNRNLANKTAAIRLERLQNERNLTFQIYQQLASQVELDRIKLKEDTPITTIIDPPVAPKYAKSPNKKFIVIMMTFIFALGYTGIFLGKEFIKSSREGEA